MPELLIPATKASVSQHAESTDYRPYISEEKIQSEQRLSDWHVHQMLSEGIDQRTFTEFGLDSNMWIRTTFGIPSSEDRLEDNSFESLQPLSQLAAEIRDWLALPVDEVARLCGTGRRNFYNVLKGRYDWSGLDRQRHIRLVHEILEDLRDSLQSDKKLRAAILMPITDDYGTFFDAAAQGDRDEIRRVGSELKERIARGRVRGMVPRAAPMFRGKGRASSALQAIRDEG